MRCPACYFDLVVPHESTRKTLKETDLYKIDDKPIDNRELHSRNPYASFSCPICMAVLSIFSKDEIGTKITCPECDNVTVVPLSVTPIVSQHEKQQIQQINGLLHSLNSEQELVITPSSKSGDIYGVSDPNLQQYYTGTPENFNPIFDDGSFGVHCSLCNTLLNATEEMIGEKLTCPDCGTETIVKKPEKPQKLDIQPLRANHFEGGGLYETRNEDTSPGLKEPLVPVICSLCETRMYAPVSDIGQWKTCPDCETQTLIKDVPQEERILPQTAGSDYSVNEQSNFKRPVFRVGADYRNVEGSLDLDNKRYQQEQERKRLERDNKDNNETQDNASIKKKGWFPF